MKLRMLAGVALLLVGLLVISPVTAVLAQEEEVQERLEMTTTYSKIEAVAGSGFEFEVSLQYIGGEEARIFDLVATGPQNWNLYISPTYPTEKQILDIRLEPPPPFQDTPPTKVLIHVSTPQWFLPEPGEYPITLEASSGEISNSIELTAVVTATYRMTVVPAQDRYNTTATAGRDNYYTIEVRNSGSAAIDDISFSTTKPSGWAVEFSPDEIDSLAALDSQTVEVNIKPPAKTIAGDYQITLKAEGNQIEGDMSVRVSVETPTIWGWVGVAIIVVVIAGLVYVFMRFSRR